MVKNLESTISKRPCTHAWHASIAKHDETPCDTRDIAMYLAPHLWKHVNHRSWAQVWNHIASIVKLLVCVADNPCPAEASWPVRRQNKHMPGEVKETCLYGCLGQHKIYLELNRNIPGHPMMTSQEIKNRAGPLHVTCVDTLRSILISIIRDLSKDTEMIFIFVYR